MNLPSYPTEYNPTHQNDDEIRELLRKSLPQPPHVPPPMHGNTICFCTRITLNPCMLTCCSFDVCQYIRLEITCLNQCGLTECNNSALLDPSTGPVSLGDYTTDYCVESVTLCIQGIYDELPLQQCICLGKSAYRVQIWPPLGTTILPNKPAIYAIVSLCASSACYRDWTITLVA